MTLYTGLDLLDGVELIEDAVLRTDGDRIVECRPRKSFDHGIDLRKGGNRALVCPAFIDLQVNGGGGLMLGDCQSVEDILTLVEAHRAGGTGALLPTLISDTPETMTRIIALVSEAAGQSPTILGLHLEGPHLAVAGAHAPDHLRPMTDADLRLYAQARETLPHLMITLAPEQVRPDQITTLADAGILVSLGHSACDYDTATAAFGAGAKGATHLFNAMSGLHHREPGLVGAALDHAAFIGLIADSHHVHPAALRVAARTRPEALYLITDAMAVAGTNGDDFELNGRQIKRSDGKLTLSDGTLAGADLTMAEAVRSLQSATDLPIASCLRAAFDTPHRALTGHPNRILPGASADLCVVNQTTHDIMWLTDIQAPNP